MTHFVRNSHGLYVPESNLAPGPACVYCDESGNSGPNYIDIEQPFYVLAAWLIPDSHQADVCIALEEFRKKNYPQRDELKASAVLRNDYTKNKCAELFGQLGKLYCLPLYLIAEKRYCVAGKIVETFLDPEYNSILKTSFTGDMETKQEIANTLYERLPDIVIRQFAEAYRFPTSADLGTALREVLQAVEQYVSPELAKAISGCTSFIDEIAQVEATISPLGDVAGTLNMPCLVSFLMLVENLGRLGLARPIKVKHDRQHAYEEGYRRIFDVHRKMPRLLARLPHSELAISNLEHVAEFEIHDSKTTLPIQAADLLAGVINHCCRIALGTQTVTEGDLTLAEAILPGLLVPEPRLTWPICSGHFFKLLGQRVFKPAFDMVEPTEKAESPHTSIALTAPVFPLKGDGKLPEMDIPRITMDFPWFTLIGQDTDNIMVVRNPDAEEDSLKSFIVLFSSYTQAKDFLALWPAEELNQPQCIVEFGPSDMQRLLHLFRAAMEWTTCVALDPGEGPLRLTSLNEIVGNLDRMLFRIGRVFTSGMDAVLLQKHRVGDANVISIQVTDGRYAAMIDPTGKIYFAATREDAILTLQQAEGL